MKQKCTRCHGRGLVPSNFIGGDDCETCGGTGYVKLSPYLIRPYKGRFSIHAWTSRDRNGRMHGVVIASRNTIAEAMGWVAKAEKVPAGGMWPK